MAGFGRTGRMVRGRPLGRRARPDHHGQGPDVARTCRSAPWACAAAIADVFQEKVFFGGLTYNSHPLACAAALATHRGLRGGWPHRERARKMGEVLKRRHAGDLRSGTRPWARTATSACSASWSWCATARRYEPMAPYNGTSPEMAELGRFFREKGLYTFVRWNTFFTNPPLDITEAQLRRGVRHHRRGAGDHRQGRSGVAVVWQQSQPPSRAKVRDRGGS